MPRANSFLVLAAYCILALVSCVYCADGPAEARVDGRNDGPEFPVCKTLETCREQLLQQQRRLRPASRPLPSVNDAVAGDWAGVADQQQLDNLKEAVIKECGSNAQRIRVVNRTIYTDYNFGPDELEYPKMFAEMLITAVWLYKDFPDVEFFVWYESAPGACHLRVPFLLTTYIKPEVAQGTGIEGSIGGVPVAIGPLYGSSSPTAERIPYTKGYAIPLPDQWLGLGMLPAQLHASQHLRFLQAEQKKPILQAQAVWRGKITGGIKGWPAPHKPSEWPYKDPWAELLLNKRVYIARVAADRQDLFDVGIISQPSDGGSPAVQRMVKSFLEKPSVPGEAMDHYAIQMNMDGWGVSARFAYQLLSNRSIVLRMQSPYGDWTASRFQAGVHYEEFKYDASDLVNRTATLLKEHSKGSKKLREKAQRASTEGLHAFHFFAQLDALMRAILKSKQACPWKVTKPPIAVQDLFVTGVPWQLLRLRRRKPSDWTAPVWRAPWAKSARLQLKRDMARHFAASAVY